MKESEKKKKIVQNRPYNTRGKKKEELERWNEPKTTKIPLLSFDNWEKIAGYSDLSELIAMGEVCADIRQAARMVYKRDYGSQEFNLRVDKTDVQMSTSIKQRNCDYHQTIVQKNVICLKFLRNFGDLIPELNIDLCTATIKSSNRLKMVLEYVNQYSGQNRKTLILDKYLPILVDEPLQNVDHIEVRSSVYSLAEFNTLIENVPNMEIRFDEAANYLRQSMPHLRTIKISAKSLNYSTGGIKDFDIVHLMRLNPQIQELIVDIRRHNVLRFKFNGTEIELKFGNRVKAIVYALVRPEQFERMCLRYFNYCDNEILNFLSRFINVTCLTINAPMGDIDKVIDIMPNVQKCQICQGRIDIYINYDIRRINQIISSATRHRKLSVLSFNFKYDHQFHKFQTEFNRWMNPGLWSITFNENGPYECKRSVVFNRIV